MRESLLTVVTGDRALGFRTVSWNLQVFRFRSRRLEHIEYAHDALLWHSGACNTQLCSVPVSYILHQLREIRSPRTFSGERSAGKHTSPYCCHAWKLPGVAILEKQIDISGARNIDGLTPPKRYQIWPRITRRRAIKTGRKRR